MLMGHVIHIYFDLPWGYLISQSWSGFVGKCHTQHSVVTLLLAINGSTYCSILLGIFCVCADEVSTGQALDGKWS